MGRRVLVAACAAVLLALALPQDAPAAKKIQLGVALKHLGEDPEQLTGFDAVSQSVPTMLTSIRWHKVQRSCRDIKRGRFDWTLIDRLAELWATNGIKMVGTLKGGPPCATARPGVKSQPKRAYMRYWAKFARRVAARYGPNGSHKHHPLRHIELWSEPNLKSWTTGPRGYAKAFVKMARKVRKGNRRVKMVSGGIGFCCAKPTKFVQTLYKVKGFARAASEIGIHTYAPNPKSALRRVRQIRRVIKRHGKRERIAITEHAWATCLRPDLDRTKLKKCAGLTRQARFMGKYVRSLRRPKNRKLKVSRFFWFTSQDFASDEVAAACPGQPKYLYGFYRFDGTPKPSKATWESLVGKALPDQIEENTEPRFCH